MDYSLSRVSGHRPPVRGIFKAALMAGAFLLLLLTSGGHEAAAQAPTTQGVVSSEAPVQPAPPTLMQVLGRMMPMFIVVFFIFYFMVIKPQQAKLKNQQSLLGSLKKGDGIITTSGIHGKVISVEDTHVMIEIAQNVRVKIERDHIARRDQ